MLPDDGELVVCCIRSDEGFSGRSLSHPLSGEDARCHLILGATMPARHRKPHYPEAALLAGVTCASQPPAYYELHGNGFRKASRHRRQRRKTDHLEL